MDKNGAAYFMLLVIGIKITLIFVLSIQMEVGSTREQPASDKLDC